jgi:pyruvate dehydrogenase E1 component alpha subunit
MLAICAFETRVNELYTRALMPGLAHLYIGQEAVAVGVSEALETTDYITSTHRGHGHCLAKGASPGRMFAELLGKEAGYCKGKGKGGSMHIADPDTSNLGANAIVCGSAGIATGAGGAELEGGTGSDREYGRLADGGGPGRRGDVRRVAGGGGVRDECGGRVPRWRR